MFQRPLADCHAAALDAFSVFGFDVKTDQPDYVEGVRPRKLNLIWGNPGGERVRVWLTPTGSEETRVVITSERAVLGMVAQKNWVRDMAHQMTESLAR